VPARFLCPACKTRDKIDRVRFSWSSFEPPWLMGLTRRSVATYVQDVCALASFDFCVNWMPNKTSRSNRSFRAQIEPIIGGFDLLEPRLLEI